MAQTAYLREGSSEERIRIVFLLLVVLLWMLNFLLPWGESKVLSDPDLLWHITTGKWIWQNGQVPAADPFSHSFAGKPWIAKEWLSQLLLFWTLSLTGWNGVILLGAAAMGLGVGLLYWVLSRDLSPILAAFACLMAITLASTTIAVRPHLLTLPLIILWTDRLFAAAREHRAPHFGLLFFLILWANLHAAFTVGFVIAFFAFLDFLERTRLTQKNTIAIWLGFLALCPVASLIHPYSWQAMMATFSVVGPNEALYAINEWQPFNAQTMLVHQMALLLAVFGAMVTGFRLGLAKALLIVVLLHLFLTHQRYAFFLFPVLPILLAPEIARQFPQTSAEHWRAQPRDGLETAASARFGQVRAGFLAVLLLLAGLQAFVFRTAPPEGTALTKALSHVRSQGITGKVFNSYDFGGTLIFNGIPTFIDGRTDQLFLDGFFNKFAFGPRNENDLAAALRQYDARWTLLAPADLRVALLDKMPGWKRVYADEFSVIHQIDGQPPP